MSAEIKDQPSIIGSVGVPSMRHVSDDLWQSSFETSRKFTIEEETPIKIFVNFIISEYLRTNLVVNKNNLPKELFSHNAIRWMNFGLFFLALELTSHIVSLKLLFKIFKVYKLR